MLLQNLKILVVVVGTLGLYTWVANAIPQVESEVPRELSFGADVTPEELVSAGEELFAGAGVCVTCHGLEDRAPTLLSDYEGTGLIGQRCADRVEGQDCKAYLYASLTDPYSYLVEPFGPVMPDQRINLSEDQLWALVAYLQDQGGEVTVTGADIQSAAEATGAQSATMASAASAPSTDATEPLAIMEASLCFGCHKLGDRGVELGPPFDGLGARLDATYIRNSIVNPNSEVAEGYQQFAGVMPPNFGQALTTEQLETVVQFLASQR